MVSERVAQVGQEWKAAEESLLAAGLSLPLAHRLAWAEHHPGRRHSLLTVSDGDRILGGAAVVAEPSRVLPAHRYLRVVRFGELLGEEAIQPLVSAMARLAYADARVLRLSVEIFSRKRRGAIAKELAREGFSRTKQPRSYRHTLTLNLARTEEEILHGLHKTARKNLRVAEKSGLHLATLTDAAYAGRIAAIQRETMARTGGAYRKMDWRALLKLSRLHPELSRVAGVFASKADVSPSALLAYSWGCLDGDHGTYLSAGMTKLRTRRAALGDRAGVPLGYPLLWDLVKWSRAQGATWFDLGGVTLRYAASDPLEGISDFKRYFSRELEEVGEEWVLEPFPRRMRLISWLSRAVRRTSRLLSRTTARLSNLDDERR